MTHAEREPTYKIGNTVTVSALNHSTGVVRLVLSAMLCVLSLHKQRRAAWLRRDADDARDKAPYAPTFMGAKMLLS